MLAETQRKVRMSVELMRAIAFFLTGLLFTLGLAAQQPAAAPPPLEKAAKAVASYIKADATGVAALFAPSFLQAVPKAKLEALMQQLYSQLGAVSQVTFVSATGPQAGVFDFDFAKGYRSRVNIVINGDDAHNITGLLLGPPQPSNDSLAAVQKALEALPGEVSYQIEQLHPGAPRVVASLHPDQALAIGSAFKLYVLGALVEQVVSGQRHWDEVVRLREHSFPSGQLQTWPLGSPLTLHTLAGLMISNSDNTAADNLLLTVGRSKVEAAQTALGNRHAERNVPFLTTLEMFQLKYGDAGRRAAYLAGDAAARQAILAKMPGSAEPAQLSSFTTAPRDIDRIEWLASAGDLCRAMAWYRSPERAEARGLLAINPGLAQLKETWAYVGYKGGSEAGVLSLNFLLRSKSGSWYAASAIWNNPSAAVDASQLETLVGRALTLVGRAA